MAKLTEEVPAKKKLEREVPKCGIIMPISATSTKTEQHWADVQTLLHRAISISGFEPVNVWNNEITDRVSERIVGNIYSADIVVADISDLNPNVMLELGLRLSSKKPTIVVVNGGGLIPFDIRDFHAIYYPSDLNILGMEVFFEKLNEALNARFNAFKEGTYISFLGKVVVDVLSPETREVPIDQLLLSRLDDIGNRLGRLEIQSGRPSTRNPIGLPTKYWDDKSKIYLELREKNNETYRKIEQFIDQATPMMSFPIMVDNTIEKLRLDVIGEPLVAKETADQIVEYAKTLGIQSLDMRFTSR